MVGARNAALGLEDFEQIRRLLNKQAGLWFINEMRPAIERRLRERLTVLGLDSFPEYCRRLSEGDALEIGEAVEACTVNETYAFRGAVQLRSFRDVILPRLASRNRVVVWSAGCSTGEEAYTLGAIALGSGLVAPQRVRIFGSDISRRCIAAARRGVYTASSFRDGDVIPYQGYFVKQPDGSRVVAETLRSVCRFRHANLLEPSVGGFIDVIFCRNVLIHMDDRSRKRIVQGFYERLSPGGYLILGHSETLWKEQTEFVTEELPDDLFYRRPEIGSGAPVRKEPR